MRGRAKVSGLLLIGVGAVVGVVGIIIALAGPASDGVPDLIPAAAPIPPPPLGFVPDRTVRRPPRDLLVDKPPTKPPIDLGRVKWDQPATVQSTHPRDIFDDVPDRMDADGASRRRVKFASVASIIGGFGFAAGVWIVLSPYRCPYCGCRRTRDFCSKCGKRLRVKAGKA